MDRRQEIEADTSGHGVPLKLIQEWLGHSSFKITADTYAHPEYSSKLAAANAMTWIEDTSLGSSQQKSGQTPLGFGQTSDASVSLTGNQDK